jgi:2-polyprenyl-3-methyl-5-hydroxy-6-metoxy-1,4-benzoquinol methylase
MTMPTSRPYALTEICTRIINAGSSSVLDIGTGFGKFGFLAREYTDVWNGRVSPDQWSVRITGIEAHEPYIGDLQRQVYDEIIIGDALQILQSKEDNEWDLGICCDVLEHFEKEDGIAFVEQMDRVCRRIMITIPVKPAKQGSVHGNVYETHRSAWTREELEVYGKVDQFAALYLLDSGKDK